MEKPQKNYNDTIAVYRTRLIDDSTTANFGDKTFKFCPLTTIDEIASESNTTDIFLFSGLDTITVDGLNGKIRPGGERLFALAIYCGLSQPDIVVVLTYYNDDALPFSPDDWLATTEERTDSAFDTICDTQDLFTVPELHERQYREFALKVSKFRQDAERERNFLESLARSPGSHEHITTFYTGFVFEKKIYLIAELADGNLDEFMAKYPERWAVEDLDREWLLAQLWGFASALDVLHGHMTYHHHDIKSTNILVFIGPAADVKHRLKFTDFGSAGYGGCLNATGLSAKSRIKGSTLALPPETHNNGSSSRPHDVWSLGCVFLDILVWHWKGWEYLKEFRSEVMEESAVCCYYTVEDGNLTTTGSVSAALDELGPTEAELAYVIQDVLEIDPGCRPNAANVLERLGAVD
ncbi:kinase-like domain-containing protein [Alternaria rosae]|uniref:kinase-like domain-containing protein n=1 Tax=Alternaria rosae TaxID=1187941 RepID=UPI001E8CD5B3|nr:kinase-like domain-containing protein [Alternaria rosae]KAH6875914.1 kinase-like domain-containing protein [Alternaria rosae]